MASKRYAVADQERCVSCGACRKGRDDYNREHGITDGSWKAYRLNLMEKVSREYVIAPAKAVNPSKANT